VLRAIIIIAGQEKPALILPAAFVVKLQHATRAAKFSIR
jgi:hypothetical protein